MGNQTSFTTPLSAVSNRSASGHSLDSSQFPAGSSAAKIAEWINFAATNYETNPTDSLLALVQALRLNNGQHSADQAIERIRRELGSDVADHVLNRQGRLERAQQTMQAVISDESTMLYQQGNQHLLQQAMEDGSSVVCAKCQAMIPATRWQPHQEFWCEAIHEEDDGSIVRE